MGSHILPRCVTWKWNIDAVGGCFPVFFSISTRRLSPQLKVRMRQGRLGMWGGQRIGSVRESVLNVKLRGRLSSALVPSCPGLTTEVISALQPSSAATYTKSRTTETGIDWVRWNKRHYITDDYIKTSETGFLRWLYNTFSATFYWLSTQI